MGFFFKKTNLEFWSPPTTTKNGSAVAKRCLNFLTCPPPPFSDTKSNDNIPILLQTFFSFVFFIFSGKWSAGITQTPAGWNQEVIWSWTCDNYQNFRSIPDTEDTSSSDGSTAMPTEVRGSKVGNYCIRDWTMLWEVHCREMPLGCCFQVSCRFLN